MIGWLHYPVRTARIVLLTSVALLPLHAQEHRRLVLQIHSIQCIDESNGKYMERIGGDEIVLSAVVVDAAGRATRAATLKAGKFEKDGAIKRYAPARVFHSFDLTSGPQYPRTFRTMLVVVERDEGGGFQTVVNALVNKVNAVTAAQPNGNTSNADLLTKAMTAAASGNVAAALTQVLSDETARLVTKKLKDDIFPPRLAEIRLRSGTARISRTGKTTAIKTVSTKAHGGRYEIKYSWRVE